MSTITLLNRTGLLPRHGSLQSFSEYRDVEAAQGDRVYVGGGTGLVEYATLELRLHPPEVQIDNDAHDDMTKITVDSANRPGTLVEVVQCLTELNLTIITARISSDGGWFVDEFLVTELPDGKVVDPKKLREIKRVLSVDPNSSKSPEHGTQGVTVLELAGQDRVGLLHDVMQLLIEKECTIHTLAVWTHAERAAFVLTVTVKGLPLSEGLSLVNLLGLLEKLMTGPDKDFSVKISKVLGAVHHERRLHVLLLREEERMMVPAQDPPPALLADAEAGQDVVEPLQRRTQKIPLRQRSCTTDFANQVDQLLQGLADASPMRDTDADDSSVATNTYEHIFLTQPMPDALGRVPSVPVHGGMALETPLELADTSIDPRTPKTVVHGFAIGGMDSLDSAMESLVEGVRAGVSMAERIPSAGTEALESLVHLQSVQRTDSAEDCRAAVSKLASGGLPPFGPRHGSGPVEYCREPVPQTPGPVQSQEPVVSVEQNNLLNYWIVRIRCRDRPKLLFDCVCTLADLDYDVYHAAIDRDGSDGVQEYYIRPRYADRCVWDLAKAQKLRRLLESSVQRRFPPGLKVHVQAAQDGFMPQLLNAFKANDISITRAKVRILGGNLGHTFYLMQAPRNQPGGQPTIPSLPVVQAVCEAAGGRYNGVQADCYWGNLAGGSEPTGLRDAAPRPPLGTSPSAFAFPAMLPPHPPMPPPPPPPMPAANSPAAAQLPPASFTFSFLERRWQRTWLGRAHSQASSN